MELIVPFLRAWTQEIVILIILATVIDLALPSGTMRKYVDYTVSLVLLLVLLGPVAALLAGGFDLSALEVPAGARGGIEELSLTPLSDQSVWLTYELLLRDRIAALARTEPSVTAATVALSLDRETRSPDFGRIVAVRLTLTVDNGTSPASIEALQSRLQTALLRDYGLNPAAVTFQVAR
ncbi:MAG: stage III sporulation protein AF [Selenomonadales bacterium]|nr:stage III sporulation protein AF [Selenomonadales bacterium]